MDSCCWGGFIIVFLRPLGWSDMVFPGVLELPARSGFVWGWYNTGICGNLVVVFAGFVDLDELWCLLCIFARVW